MNADLYRAQLTATILSAVFTVAIAHMDQWLLAAIDGVLTAYLFWVWRTPQPVE